MENNYLDVHGLTLIQAQRVITKAVFNAFMNDISVLYVNHGFNSGEKIKSWCRTNAIKLKHVIKVEPGDNEGISKLYIQTNFFK